MERKAAEKAAKERQQMETAALFKTIVVQPKVPLGVDPKSIVCEFFRAKQCSKGERCKFSHDLNVSRKGSSCLTARSQNGYSHRRSKGERSRHDGNLG